MNKISNIFKSKNIKFNIINEEQAENIVNNEYSVYRLLDYCDNFEKYTNNPIALVNVDFYHIYAFAKIDEEFSLILMKMCIQIESNLKLIILRDYDHYILANLLNEYYYKNKKHIDSLYNIDNINYFHNNQQTNNLFDNSQLYNCISMMQFGTLIRFYNYILEETDYSKKTKYTERILELESVRRIRNQVAHSNSLLTSINTKCSSINHKLRRFFRTNGINKKMLKTNMSSQIIYDICNLVDYYFNHTDVSNATNTINELIYFLDTTETNYKNYFLKYTKLVSFFVFFKKVVNIYKKELTN